MPLPLPGGVARDSRKAAEYLLEAPGALVLVDGYNVAKLAWPDDDLAGQRERLLDAAETVARRFGSEITVVFDGADVVGAHAAERRDVAGRLLAGGRELADDVIRARCRRHARRPSSSSPTTKRPRVPSRPPAPTAHAATPFLATALAATSRPWAWSSDDDCNRSRLVDARVALAGGCRVEQ